MPASDGWCALTLSRQDDIDAVPALVESDADDPWQAVQQWVAADSSADVASTRSRTPEPAVLTELYFRLSR